VGSVSGLKANAAKFVSTNQQTLSISDNASISAGNIDLTLAAHVYLNNATTTYYIIDKSNNGSSMEYRLSYTSGKLRFRFGTGLLDSPSVSANAWHTVVA
jgi:predicted transcriptional regulator